MSTFNWMKRKIKGINKERMDKTLKIIHENTGKSLLYIKFDLFRNFLLRGIGYTDYFRGNYILLTKEEKDTFVTTKSFYKLISYLNDERYEILLHDKLLFNEIWREYLGRDYYSLLTGNLEGFKKFLKGRDVVFAKVTTGEGGHGVTKIKVNEVKNIEELWKKLIDNKQYLVEEAIVQAPDVNEINPNVVNSLRIVTLYKDGKVYVLNNAFRINQDDTEVIGCTNDLYFSLNEEGIIDSNVIDDYANVYLEHPMTKKKFKDVKIKGVKEAFKMCVEAHQKIPQVRYIGWDVAFSLKGPVIVEGNEYPGYGLIQFYKLKNKKTGHLKEIADVLKEEMNNIKL